MSRNMSLEYIFPTMEQLELDYANDFEIEGVETRSKEHEHVFTKPRSVQSIAQRVKDLNVIKHLTCFKVPKKIRLRHNYAHNNATARRKRKRKPRMR